MNIDKKLEALQKIKRVEAPPFLLTRIEAKINSYAPTHISPQWKWIITASFTILLFANAYVVFSFNKPVTVNNIEKVVTSMHLSTSNDLYNE